MMICQQNIVIMHNNRQFDKIFETIRKSIIRVRLKSDEESIQNDQSTNPQGSPKKLKKSVTFRFLKQKGRCGSSLGSRQLYGANAKRGSKKGQGQKSINPKSKWQTTKQYQTRAKSTNYQSSAEVIQYINGRKRRSEGEDDLQLDIHAKIRQIRDQVGKTYPNSFAVTKKCQSVPVLKKISVPEDMSSQKETVIKARTQYSGTLNPNSASQLQKKALNNNPKKTKELILSKLPTTQSFMQQTLANSRLKTRRLLVQSRISDTRVDLARSILKYQIMKKLTI